MRIYYSERQQAHVPRHFVFRGRQRPNPEVPERVEELLKGAVTVCDAEIQEPRDFGLKFVSQVHTARYLDFLQTAHSEWKLLPGSADEIVPNVHPRDSRAPYPTGVLARAGYHMYDLSCPISEKTWLSAIWSAHCSASAASAVACGAPFAYALCRPPGHHAGTEFAGGFSYINNAAVAATVLRKKFDRVAVVDVDVHHGNGTQDIFYHRNDVLTISLHGDPAEYYPFYTGFSHETGEDIGHGFNLNIPLARNSGDHAYLQAMTGAIRRLERFSPEALVVSLGLDAYENDPLAFLRITTEGFDRIARVLGALKLPAVFVQEGGYMSADLGRNLASFLRGFERGWGSE